MGKWEATLLFLIIKDGKTGTVVIDYSPFLNIKIEITFVLKMKNTWRMMPVFSYNWKRLRKLKVLCFFAPVFLNMRVQVMKCSRFSRLPLFLCRSQKTSQCIICYVKRLNLLFANNFLNAIGRHFCRFQFYILSSRNSLGSALPSRDSCCLLSGLFVEKCRTD